MIELKCPHCHKLIEPYYEDGRTTVPMINGKDGIIDMGSWWACPKCDEILDHIPEDYDDDIE